MIEFQVISTPDPALHGFRIGLRLDHWRGTLPTVGQAYKNLDLSNAPRPMLHVPGYPDYIYTYWENGTLPTANGQDIIGIWLYYVPVLTAQQIATPYKTFSNDVDLAWPMVAEEVTFTTSFFERSLVDYDGQTLEMPKIRVNAYGKPAYNGPTRRVTELFLSHQPFVLPVARVPIPDMIVWDIPGADAGGFPSCLHGEIVLPPVAGRYQKGSGGSAEYVQDSGGYNPKVLEPTNFSDWAPYSTYNQVELPSRMWELTKYTFHPPRVKRRQLG